MSIEYNMQVQMIINSAIYFNFNGKCFKNGSHSIKHHAHVPGRAVARILSIKVLAQDRTVGAIAGHGLKRSLLHVGCHVAGGVVLMVDTSSSEGVIHCSQSESVTNAYLAVKLNILSVNLNADSEDVYFELDVQVTFSGHGFHVLNLMATSITKYFSHYLFSTHNTFYPGVNQLYVN